MNQLTSQALCQISIDGARISVPAGSSILEAAQQRGIDIPTLCFDPLLTPEGVCRLCCVEIDGMHGLVSSCTTAVHDGMQVHTTTDKVRENQRQILGMVLQNFGTVGPNDPAQKHYATLSRMAEAAGLSPATGAVRSSETPCAQKPTTSRTTFTTTRRTSTWSTASPKSRPGAACRTRRWHLRGFSDNRA